MSVPRERFAEGVTWDDWLERLGPGGAAWRQRYDRSSLGELRVDYQDIPTPRFVLCLFDPGNASAQEAVPVLAKACDQAGLAGGVDLRLFPVDEHPGLADQYRADRGRSFPACIVFDRDWVQVGLWRMTADAERETDWTRSTLRGFLAALRGQPNRPWHGHQNHAEHRANQAERAPGAS